MLFDITVKIKAPGQSTPDAIARLKGKIPHWEFEVIEAAPSENQPAPVTGVGAITLPISHAHGIG